MPYIIPDHLIGKMPCMWCGRTVIFASMDGPGVCISCDIGMKYENGKLRKWEPGDSELKRYISGEPHPDFLAALKAEHDNSR